MRRESMTPDELLKQLKSNSSRKIQTTLDAIYKVCSEQRERSIDDYSIATIARLGAGHGVPAAQSIRNKSGEKYRALIKSFEDSSPVKDLSKGKGHSQDWIDEIANPKHKLLAKIQASELNAAEKKLREIIPPNQRIDVYDHKSLSLDSEHKLTGLERTALEYLISDKFMNKWKFKESDYGEVLDSEGNVVFKVATIDALKKALRFL